MSKLLQLITRLSAMVVSIDIIVASLSAAGGVVDDVLGSVFGCMHPREPNSEVDDDQNDCNHNSDHILHNDTDVATECHVSTLLGIVILPSVVVVRSLKCCNVKSLPHSINYYSHDVETSIGL